jgi:hypothetical protein
MHWPKRIAAWLQRREGRTESATAPSRPDVFVLNGLLDLPTGYATQSLRGSRDAELYLLDYNYIDAARTAAFAASLAQVRATHDLDFSRKTLLLAAKGLHPAGAELIRLLREFGTYLLFFELWNGLKEVVELAHARIEHLYFFPVASRLQQPPAGPQAARPNSRVFVSLGGDDDLDLICEVIARCPNVQFFVPDVSWAKPGSEKRFFDVRIPAANVTGVDCSEVRTRQQLSFSSAYRSAFARCDTVLIATLADKIFQMRGGVRLADALHAGKHIVITENPLCQLVMAQHEKTCLVAPHDAAAVAAHLTRICAGEFRIDEPTYEAVRHLTVEDNKLPWMLRAARDPAAARTSVFARGADVLEVTRRSLLARGRQVLEREIRTVAGDAARHEGGDARVRRSS